MQRVAMSVSIGLFLAILLNVLAPQPALAVSCGHNKSHNAFFGTRLPHQDQLLYMEHPRVSGKWFREVSYPISYPNPGDVRGLISYIEVLDQFTDGTGGCALIKSGGIRSNEVSLELVSQRGKGLDFVIRIFGNQ
ncbi:probable salivary secreted peptide [Cimex lectularius]|uniref:Salivary secreted peptide n=1 Tax=Cimex lectularius TaxID=79782 RepID=A0A8I6TGI3_CIMLE|nr:probable salivary secreted peptide [Cimex lectularius]